VFLTNIGVFCVFITNSPYLYIFQYILKDKRRIEYVGDMTTVSTDTHTKLVLNRLFGQGVISCKIRNILNRELIEKVEKLSKVQLYGIIKDARIVQNRSKSKLYHLALNRYYNELIYNFNNINGSCKYDIKNDIYNNLCNNWSPTSETMDRSNDKMWVYYPNHYNYKLLLKFNLDESTLYIFIDDRSQLKCSYYPFNIRNRIINVKREQILL
jgi:hypothetical protein